MVNLLHTEPDVDIEDIFKKAEKEFLVKAPMTRPEVFGESKNKPLKRQSQLQQTTNFATSFLIFEKKSYDIS